jgi:hypothetical protein
VADAEFSRLDVPAQKRVRETLALMEDLSAWTDQMLSLDRATLARLMKLGARVQALLGRGTKAR